mgnify:CR=1 FL=1
MSVYITRRIIDSAAEGHMRKNASGQFQLWLRRAVRNWQRRKMIAVLVALDDRILTDIGVHRGDIECVVSELDARELRMVPVARTAKPVKTQDEEHQRAV